MNAALGGVFAAEFYDCSVPLSLHKDIGRIIRSRFSALSAAEQLLAGLVIQSELEPEERAIAEGKIDKFEEFLRRSSRVESERIFGIDVERALQDRLVLLEPSFKIG